MRANRPQGALSLPIATGLLLLVLFRAGPLTAEADSPPSPPRLGMNLAGPADWNTELPFVDVFRLSRPWISQQKGRSWGEGPELEVDHHGWVKELEADCWAETLLCTIDGNHYPSGTYTILYEGVGNLDVGGAASALSREPGRMTIDVDASRGAMFLKLTATEPTNPVRNIRVIMPGFETSYAAEPFHPGFLERWKDMACLRFMDWMKTNGSSIESWSQRPAPADATCSARGVPLEVMIDLCNRLHCDPWFCMPHRADDQFVERFARMVKEQLDPDLKVYIEYSNEVWNSIFEQNRYAQDQAKRLGLGARERPWEGGGMYYAQRSTELFRIWEKVFGGRDRLVRVLAWQSGNTWWMENIVLTHQDAYRQADALGIAPYLGMNVPKQGKELNAEQVARWTVDQALDYLETNALPTAVQDIRNSKRVADRFGLKLIAYEGGQHMVGVAGGENHEAMTTLFHAANTHPGMGRIYHEYFDAWAREGGDLFCYFSSVSAWSKWGSWGALQYHDDDPAASPKMKALVEWGKRLRP